MKECMFTLCLLFTLPVLCMAQVIESKIVDDGGSGPYTSIAAQESTLSDFVVYRPADLEAASDVEGQLPVVVFGNGACMNTSIDYERALTEIASHGYVIIAIGALQTTSGRERSSTESSMLIDAMDWITSQSSDSESAYYGTVDELKIAAAGHSCGGAQTLYASDDSRVKTAIMFNSGMGEMTMAGADKESLESLQGPIVYIIGGPSDVAYANAELDYQAINHVPVALADLDIGHAGTFDQEYGGSYAKMALAWLDWQFKGLDENSAVFLENDLSDFPEWTIKAKNFQ